MSPLKTGFKKWRSFLNEDLMIENRSSDALAYAQNFNKGAKQFRVKDVIDQMTEEQIAMLKKGAERAVEVAKKDDPSGDNKYLMWVARFIRKDIMRRLQKYSSNWGTNPMDWDDPEGVKLGSVHSPDYVAENIADLVVENVVSLTDPIKNYHRVKQKGFMKKDIYDYDPTNEIGDFKNDVKLAIRKLKDREEQDELKKQTAGEADDILDNDDFAVLRPNTEGASCYYGWGTRWCISAREARNYFNQYTGEGKTFYFVMFRHLPNSSPFKKMALVYGKDQGDSDPEQVFDALDEELGDVGLIQGITDNLIYKILKQAERLEGTRKRLSWEEDPEEKTTATEKAKDDIAKIIEDPQDSGKSFELVLSIAQTLFPDTYSDETDFEIQPLGDKFEELVQEIYGEITGQAAYHAEENPAGPKGDDYLKVFDQYAPFNNIYVNYDEYDTNSWYWDASFRIAADDPHFADLHIPENVDMDDFADAVHKGIDQAGIYPDEVEGDGYDNEANIRLTPDFDEQQGLDGFERFLDRMSDIDSILGQPDFWETVAESLIEQGLTGGGLKELEDKLDEIDLNNIEYGREGKEFTIVLELDPVIARPKGISGLYFGQMINTFSGQQLSGPKLPDPDVGSAGNISGPQVTNIANSIGEITLDKIEGEIKARYDDIWDQMDLPGFERDAADDKELDAFPLIDIQLVARPDKIDLRTPGTERVPFSSKERDKGAGGTNIEYPYNLLITLTNEQYWETIGVDEEELETLITFLKWIDQDEVKDHIEALLQGTLNDAVLQYMKDHPQRSEKDLEDEGLPTSYADVKSEEQKLNELYKRWGKMIK